VDYLLTKYEDKLEIGYPSGYTFQQMYDLDTEVVKPRFQTFYERMKAKFEDLGLHFDERYA
jgi:hypothetical protein